MMLYKNKYYKRKESWWLPPHIYLQLKEAYAWDVNAIFHMTKVSYERAHELFKEAIKNGCGAEFDKDRQVDRVKFLEFYKVSGYCDTKKKEDK